MTKERYMLNKDHNYILYHFIYTTSCNKFKIVQVESKLIFNTTPFPFKPMFHNPIHIWWIQGIQKYQNILYNVAFFVRALFNKTSSSWNYRSLNAWINIETIKLSRYTKSRPNPSTPINDITNNNFLVIRKPVKAEK